MRLGLMICMDREYPEAARALSRQGAEIVLCRIALIWLQIALSATCASGRPAGVHFEAVISIAVANYPVPRCDGHSFAVDPSGRIIAMADASPGLVLATFDLGAIRKERREERFRWQI